MVGFFFHCCLGIFCKQEIQKVRLEFILRNWRDKCVFIDPLVLWVTMFKQAAAKKLNKKKISFQCFLALLETSPSGAHVTGNCSTLWNSNNYQVGPYSYINVRVQRKGKQTGLCQTKVLPGVKEFNFKTAVFNYIIVESATCSIFIPSVTGKQDPFPPPK